MLDNHKAEVTGQRLPTKARAHTTLRKLQQQNREFLTIGSLGTDVACKLPTAVAEWLIAETLKLPAVGGAKLPSVASLIALLCIDAYHDDLEERMASKGKRR
tara:strand:+ start:1340 stop:1645 length:306 start_codon:yes stop_codon:yes gene_type:complete